MIVSIRQLQLFCFFLLVLKYFFFVCFILFFFGFFSFATEFVETTHHWSSYFLNDALLARRPWFFRPHHRTIDAILEAHPHTLYSKRMHPEDFASKHSTTTWRGLWNVPQNNPLFVGREKQLADVDRELGESGFGGVAVTEVVGLGGVGKTQMMIEYCHRSQPSCYQSFIFFFKKKLFAIISQSGMEWNGMEFKYCHRHYQRRYGLIVWIHSETAASLITDFQNLALANGIEIKDRPSDEVITRQTHTTA
jgi:hypothetical protein